MTAEKPVLIEKTSKKYKLMQLVGLLLALAGLGACLAVVLHVESTLLAVLGGTVMVVGLVIGIAGGTLAWWHHG